MQNSPTSTPAPTTASTPAPTPTSTPTSAPASTDTQPKISLLIPIYNVQNYLRQCLESAQNQTLRDIEIICINDGSTDGSRAIVEEFLTDTRFRIIDKPNSGYGASMNMGLSAARGEYVGILESDDFLDADALEVLYKAAKDSNAEVAKADFYFYWSAPNPHDKRFGWVKPSDAGLRDPRTFTGVFYRKPSIWSAIYSRNFLDTNNIRFQETPGASFQDTSFNFKVWACAQRVALIDRAFLHYRQDNEASSVNSADKMLCVCDEYDEITRFVQADPSRAWLRPIVVAMRYDIYVWNYLRLAEPLQREFVERMAQDFHAEDASGATDYNLIDPWKVVDRKLIMSDPQEYHRRMLAGAKHSKFSVLARCFQAGGLPLVWRALRQKIAQGQA